MKTAKEIYEKVYSKKKKYFKEAVLEKAKELISQELDKDEYYVDIDEQRDLEIMKLVIASTPKYDEHENQGKGDIRLWYQMIFDMELPFPTEELNDWLKQYGWKFKFKSQAEPIMEEDDIIPHKYEISFKVWLESEEFLRYDLDARKTWLDDIFDRLRILK